jgi:spore coat polysaccharide biosynthesis predicted glycosyltransferase SpsG
MEGDQIWRLVQNPMAVLIDTRSSDGVNDLIRSAQNQGVPVISIHDLGLQLLPSDIIIDGSIAPKQLGPSFQPMSYRSGTDYMILDPIYSWLHQEKKQIRDSIQSIYVNLGGGDSARFYPAILEGLKLLEKEIEVVGVPGFISWGQEALAQQNWGRLRFRWESHDLDRILFNADAAITAGGVSAYEALCAGTPLLCMSYDHFQQITISNIGVRGGCIDLGPGDALNPSTVAGLVSHLESDREKRANMSRIGRSIVDGRGAERVSQLIRKAIADYPFANSLRQLNDSGADF